MALIFRKLFWTSKVKSSPNPIMTQNIAYLQNGVKRLQIIILSYPSGAFHHSAILEI